MSERHLYEVGMGSDKQTIEAPSAGAAAMYYALRLVNTNNPFMAVVYSEDGKPFEGERFWLSLTPDEAHVKMVAERVGVMNINSCKVVEDAPAQPPDASGGHTWDELPDF
jgi:hypothetical protein